LDSKNYVIGWDMWFDDGTDTPRHYHCKTLADLEGLPEDGLQTTIVHFCDGTNRQMIQADVVFFAPHPAGGIIFGQVGFGDMRAQDHQPTINAEKARFPGARVFLGRHTTYWILKQAVDAAMAARMTPEKPCGCGGK